ncbi:MAG: CapA family protein [Cyanobacteria bacterium P01_H01_bin.21]
MVNTPVDINQVKQLAATGHFRSIALWLNHLLVPQSIYAQVQTDRHPGYVQIFLEFERSPKKDALIRLVCNRICRLESDVIRGVYLVGRLIGSDQPLWQQRVKLSQRKRSAPPAIQNEGLSPAAPVSAPAVTEQTKTAGVAPETVTATTYGNTVLNAVPSYLIPRDSNTQDRRRRQNRTVAPFPTVQIRPTDIDSNRTSTQRRMSRRRLAPKETIEQQFKYMRAIVVTGSAAAAFILGCVTEAVLSQRGQIARKASPSLPTFSEGGWRQLSDVETQEIAYRTATRGTAVPAALEPVAVMPHQSSSDPQDPTVTLMFGGEVPVGDVPLQTPDAVEQVLGELDVFREADVAMIGLGNSLATADTSLQENYFDRTRPDAVDALIKGGIDIVGLNGEATMDFGRQGLLETLDALDGAGIYRVGAGRDYQEARRPEVLEVKGQRIAYLSYAPNSEDLATLGQAGLNIQERDEIIEDIAALREAVDWIVVNYRWYGDLDVEPNSQQVELSRSAIDAGADLVVGYHPQQLQGAELYNSRPIVYSLGDFIFQDEPLADHDTAALRVSLRDKQMKVEFLPVTVKEAQPLPAVGETAKTILKQIRDASNGLSAPLQFPVILDAPLQTKPALKPENPAVKTLGELEPAPSNANPPSYLNEGSGLEQEEPLIPETFENFTPDSDVSEEDMSNPDRFGSGVSEPVPLNPAGRSSDVDQNPSEGISPNPMLRSPIEGPAQPAINPLDSFNTQPFNNEDGLSAPYETWNSPLPTEPSPTDEPEVTEDGPILEPTEAPLLEEDGPILEPTEAPLPGYDALDDWGQKLSPHKEFNPIEQRQNSQETSSFELLDESDVQEFPPGISTDSEAGAFEGVSDNDAISPHDEPLVGPLSQQPSEFSSDKLAS